MISRAFFDLEVAGKPQGELYANVKQTVGSSFVAAPLEVSRPANYQGPFNFQAFRDAVERYYRDQVGEGGHGIRIKRATNVRMRNNTFVEQRMVEFDINDTAVPW